jgi:predicted amidohydrolase
VLFRSAYLELVKNKKVSDPVIYFQLRNEFEVIGLLKDYLRSDKESLGYATHMLWRNPNVSQDAPSQQQRGRMPETVRVASVQYQLRQISSFDEFISNVRYFVDIVSNYKGDFVVFPELFTLQLLSMDSKQLRPAEALKVITGFTEQYKAAMSQMAVQYNVNIIGGSHPTLGADGEVYNVCYVFLRDGSIHQQFKLHPTPNERFWWNIRGGSELDAIMTDCGPIGVLICYDSEFPETARHLVNQGAQILFVPFCTDERQGYLRVRYCAHARAVENQCYVVLSGTVGNLPGVENMDMQYAQSCILTPCDFPFARDGIAADTTPNVEMLAIADLRPTNLMAARNSGTVQNLKDRRFDLYSVQWHKN